ncbi:MAG: hypothetical protein IPN29_17530 [Saprospiraceae bacterium]|nr:hypothetical protein [Saprospiraceae bacterium]
MKPVFLSIFLSFFCFSLLAQQDASISQLTVNDGLSQGMIFDILQTRDGFIWIASKDGLNRYDGSRFEIFSPDPFNPFAIGGSEVQALFEDSRGWLWISLPDGIDIYDPGSGYFFHIKHKNKSIPSQFVTESSDGVVWLANNHELIKITPHKEQLKQAIKQRSANIEVAYKSISLKSASGWSGSELMALNLHFTKGKKLLIGTNHGLFSIDPDSELIVPEIPARDHKVSYISENRAGEILIGTYKNENHYWSLISKGKVFQKISPMRNAFISGQLLDDKGCVWLAQSKHLIKWKLSDFLAGGKSEIEVSPVQLDLDYNNGFAYYCLMTDRSGILWAGTTGFGIVSVNEKGQKFKTYLPRTGHRLILEDLDGALYTALQPDKKFLHNNFDISVSNTGFPIAEVNGKRSLVFDHEGNMWWLSDKIFRKDAVTRAISHWPFEGLAMIRDRNGKLISVSEKGLHRFDPVTKVKSDFPFDQPRKQRISDSYFLYEDVSGNLWIFGLDGLIKASPAGSGYTYLYFVNNPEYPSSLSINTVHCAVDDPLEPMRYLWIGTREVA